MRDEDFIFDDSRLILKRAIASHLKHTRSLAIIGEHGEGKTEMLKRIELPFGKQVKKVDSRGYVYQMLAQMAGVDLSEAKSTKVLSYLRIIESSKPIILMDEAHHAREGIYQYLKTIMDAGSSVILAGQPKLLRILKDRHSDVLSRITAYPLAKIGYDLLQEKLPDFDGDAWLILISGRQDSSRSLSKLIDLCRDRAEENDVQRVDFQIVSEVLSEIIDDKE